MIRILAETIINGVREHLTRKHSGRTAEQDERWSGEQLIRMIGDQENSWRGEQLIKRTADEENSWRGEQLIRRTADQEREDNTETG
jgi:hypothetical protein